MLSLELTVEVSDAIRWATRQMPARDPSLPAAETKTVARQHALSFRSYTCLETLGPEPFRIDKPSLVYVEVVRSSRSTKLDSFLPWFITCVLVKIVVPIGMSIPEHAQHVEAPADFLDKGSQIVVFVPPLTHEPLNPGTRSGMY